MQQSKRMSVVESAANTVGGGALALWVQIVIFPVFGITVPVTTNIGIFLIMFAQSAVRQYIFRRFFNWLHHRSM